MNSLYNLQAQYLWLLQKDEYTHEDMKALDELPGFIEDNIIQRCYIIRDLEYLIASINCEMTNMASRRDKLQKNLSLLQESCINAMEIAQIKKIEKCPNFKIAVQGKKPRVDDFDRKTIPEEYWYLGDAVIEKKLDKDRLHADLAAGKDIPGARLVDPVKLVIK
jgi:hypothetical protein